MQKGGYIIFLFLLVGCIENFELPRASELRTLVVDGKITDRSGPYFVRLTNTKLISGDTIPQPESGAIVTVEEEGGPLVTLSEIESGVYRTDAGAIQGQVGKRYQLNVQLFDGKEYQSPWELMLPTPEIQNIALDFITKGSANGLQMYLDAEDETGQVSYFRWEVEETWQYKVPYASTLLYGQAQLKPEEDFHETCWITRSRLDIMLATVNNQSKNAVVNHPLAFVSADSARLNIRYSALIKQYAIGLDEFSFWKGLKSTNEDVGGLYDNQPFQVVSNMKRLSDENEPVFGYFSASSIKEKRIYIDREDFPENFLPTKTFSDCPLLDLSTALAATHYFYLSNGIYLFVYPDAFFTTPPCGDCEAYGGTTFEPTFWEE